MEIVLLILIIIVTLLVLHSQKEMLGDTGSTGSTATGPGTGTGTSGSTERIGESATGTSTATVDENAFTGLTCLGETIFRYKKVSLPSPTLVDKVPLVDKVGENLETLRCLINPKTNACYTKDELFEIGKAPSCEKFNETLVKQVRDVNSISRKIFNASNPYSVFECTVHGLNNKNHWCNKVNAVILKTDCSNPFKNRLVCDHQIGINNFLKSTSTETRDVIPFRYSLTGASCVTKCTRTSGAIPPSPDSYDCQLRSKGKVTGPDPDCDATKAKMKPAFDAYNAKYGECLSSCINIP